METTITASGAAEAIREVERITKYAIGSQIITLEVTDGGGGIGKIPAVVLKDSEGASSVHLLGNEILQAAAIAKKHRLESAKGPDNRAGTAVLQTLESFIGHANRFKAENSAVWANAEKRELVSVLDYHPAGAESAAAWGRHRGIYACPLSEAWTAWGGVAGLSLDQEEFADLLDSRDRELSPGDGFPTPASLITLANNLEVYSNATAKRERDPNTGKVKVSFSEEKGVLGQVMPPPAFKISIPVFRDAPVEDVEVRLRVTVDGGHATFNVQIHAATELLETSFRDVRNRVMVGTSLPVFVGVPE